MCGNCLTVSVMYYLIQSLLHFIILILKTKPLYYFYYIVLFINGRCLIFKTVLVKCKYEYQYITISDIKFNNLDATKAIKYPYIKHKF